MDRTKEGKTEVESLKAPFPWFGGKSRVADIVWNALGDVACYIEPFGGSLAVLLGRPASHKGGSEVVNDIDAYLCNFYRALQHDPDGVAYYADWPMNEVDLTARHIWLVNTGRERVERLFADPDYYDVQAAGWWVWGQSFWVGNSWCHGDGPWTAKDGRLIRLSDQERQDGKLRGVRRSIGKMASQDGVHRRSLSSPGALVDYFRKLAERLRYVQVCCGDWSRVLTKALFKHSSTIGIFFDPPYDPDIRDKGLYRVDEKGISAQVREWAIIHGDNPQFRIVLAGYEGEHDMPPTWRKVVGKAVRAWGTSTNPNSPNAQNRHKERLWLSPHCVGISGLFDLF